MGSSQSHNNNLLLRRRIFIVHALEFGRLMLQALPVITACILVAFLCHLLKLWIADLDGDKTSEWQSLGWSIMRQVWEFIVGIFQVLPSDVNEATVWLIIIILLVAAVVAGAGLVIVICALLVDALDWLFMSNVGQTAVVVASVLLICTCARPLLQLWRGKWKTRTNLESRYRDRLVQDICQCIGVTTSSDVQKLIMEYRGNECDDDIVRSIVDIVVETEPRSLLSDVQLLTEPLLS